MNMLEHPRLLPRAACLSALVLLAAASQAVAEPSCAELARGRPAAGAGASADCEDYAPCMGRGRQLLREGAPGPAAQAFKKAAAAAVQDTEKQEAYGCLGIAREADGDIPWAQAALEAARAVSSHKLNWAEAALKRLLSSQTLATAEYLEKKREADSEISQLAGGALAARPEAGGEPPAEEEPNTIAQAQPEENGGGTQKWRGFGGIVVATAKEPPPTSKPGQRLLELHKPPAKSKLESKPSVAACRPDRSPALAAPVYFAFGSAELTPQDQAQADEIAKFLEASLADERRRAVLVGHTDRVGSAEENQLLSEQRAEAVKAYLLAKSSALKERKDRLGAQGVGKSHPRYCETDDPSQALNRRVEIRLDSD